MKRFLIAACSLLAAAVVGSPDASAQGFGDSGFGFAPYGFYQPFGARYSTSIRTPPYFATNPPVYYGARHARPYGLSPFAAPPMVQAGPGYESRARTPFVEPLVPTLGPAPACNPYIHHSTSKALRALQATDNKIGAVQDNPFVQPVERIAKQATDANEA
ncbi:hypothetical protein K227x_45360 [Rubripirellula lacrimiformis]|uniref:Uncharacterized protein n=1 Tax=Rubripirellula lacrimiformis TaxID=1930273 RepID=A0A517NGB3_9BACT|nr:hypothetical protein [Rubripirellula lacrimiformis]QDT06128.1 hypothetical protein K227x_45360 [Rubripirellula lacrimiformis]